MEIVAGWNRVATATGMTRILKLTVNRKFALRRRLVEFPDYFDLIIKEWKVTKPQIKDLGFLNCDWLLVEDNWIKFMEGNYRTRQPVEDRGASRYDALKKYGKTWRQP